MIGPGTLPCVASGCGQVKLSLSYALQERHLTVIVHACRCASSSVCVLVRLCSHQ